MTDPLTVVRHSRVASLVRSHPVAGFFALSFAVSWSAWIPLFLSAPDATSLVMIPGAFGPAVSAATVIWLRGESVRDWLSDCLDWRVGRRWYLAAVTLPVGIGVALGIGLVAVTGSFGLPRNADAFAIYPIALLFAALVGGGQEEFGWRGYALPVLQARFDALTASLLVGVAWGVWHLPAFAFGIPGYTGSFVSYLLLVVGVSIVFTWLYNSTGRSVLPAVLLHGGVNAAPNLGVAFVGDPSAVGVSPSLVLVPTVWAVALGLLARYGHETLASGPAATTPSSEAESPVVST